MPPGRLQSHTSSIAVRHWSSHELGNEFIVLRQLSVLDQLVDPGPVNDEFRLQKVCAVCNLAERLTKHVPEGCSFKMQGAGEFIGRSQGISKDVKSLPRMRLIRSTCRAPARCYVVAGRCLIVLSSGCCTHPQSGKLLSDVGGAAL